ncbi:MAG TPA: Ig domain-containing protein [Candidatus Dormibacteraeota bacterium]|nr:Ig domain-containing protein [Candidatus Dormibacteraeota bacterium]
MRFAVVRGGWPTAFAAVLLLAAACSPQCGKPSGTASTSPTPSASASPSTSALPTAPLQASSPPFHGGEVGVAYGAVALAATGGRAPYSWGVFSGALPAGMTLGNDGSVSGTPTTAGNFSFTIQVKDAGDSTASIPVTIGIAPALTAGLIAPCAQYCNVELGCDSTCGAFGQQDGGVGPFTYSLTGGQLPAGTALNGLSLKGTFGGSSGWLQFTVQVSDALGGSASIAPKFWMYPHISLTGGTIPPSGGTTCWWTGYDPVNAPGCRATFPYSGGTPNSGAIAVSTAWVSYTCNYAPACTTPPPAPTITVGGGVVTVTVPRGYSLSTSGYKGTLSITLTNQDACSGGPTRCSASANVTITQASG